MALQMKIIIKLNNHHRVYKDERDSKKDHISHAQAFHKKAKHKTKKQHIVSEIQRRLREVTLANYIQLLSSQKSNISSLKKKKEKTTKQRNKKKKHHTLAELQFLLQRSFQRKFIWRLVCTKHLFQSLLMHHTQKCLLIFRAFSQELIKPIPITGKLTNCN